MTTTPRRNSPTGIAALSQIGNLVLFGALARPRPGGSELLERPFG